MKNKVLSILAIFITFITLSCKTDLIEKETTPQSKGLISIKIGNNAKMLSPNTDNIEISSISNWTVTFTNKEDTTKQLKRSTSTGTLKEYLPFGTYIIEIEGTTQSEEDGSPAIAFYGKTEAAISPEEKTTTANIYVAPKKSENGTGSFEYNITMKETESLQPLENTFTAKLSAINSDFAPIEITSDATENSDEGTYTIEFTKHDIPSGYYKLTISCTTKITEDTTTTVTQSLQKNILVEICDNAKTSDSIELQVEDYKTLYAVTPTADDGNKYANYSGEFKQYPADFLNILNDDTITNATINMLPNNIPIINPSKIKDKIFQIWLYNETPEPYGYLYTNSDGTNLELEPNKSLMLLGNDNYEESILNLYIYPGNTSEPTTQVTLLNGSPSIYLSSYSSSKFEFNINTPSDYYDKPFIQYDSEEEEEYLLRIFDVEDNTKIASFDGITLNGNNTENENNTDKIVYTSIPQPLNDETPYNIQYFILPSQKGSIPKYTINADTPNICLYEKVTFTIQGEFTPDTKFKWYANRKLVQDGPNKSYTHTAQFTTDEVLCFIYQDENNYTTVNATEQINLNVTKDKTPIALYSAVSDPGYYSLYNLTLTDVKNISKGISSISNFDDIDKETSHIDNCYDNNNTLWWVTDSCIFNSKNVSLEMPDLRYIDFDTETLYATTMDFNASIYKITEEMEKYSYEQLFITEAPITCITFHNDYCYTIEIEEVSDDAGVNTTTYTLKKYKIPESSLPSSHTAEKSTQLLTKTKTNDDNGNEIITFSDLIFDNDKSIVNTLKNPLFSDIQVTNEGIFVLFNDCYYYKYPDKPKIDANSRGGIIKFDDNLELDATFGPNGIFGWTNKVHTSYGTNNNTTYTITSYMPDFPADTQLSSKYFYSPRKFLAIKPKKLIFADDGFMFYGNNNDTSSKEVNQLIEFDIEKAMFDSYNLDLSIDFNKRAKGTGSVAASFYWDN